MKILIISTNVFPLPLKGYGGLEALVYNLSEGLAKRGHLVSVVCPDGSFFNENIECIYTQINEDEGVSWQRYRGRMESGEWDVILDSSWQRWSTMSSIGKEKQLPIVNWHHTDPSIYATVQPITYPCWVGLSKDHAERLAIHFGVPVKYCIHEDTMVSTEEGQLSIREIVEHKKDIRIAGFTNRTSVYQRILDYQKIPSFSPLIKIKTEFNNTLLITPDNAIMGLNGWVLSSALKVGDYVWCESSPMAMETMDEGRGQFLSRELQKASSEGDNAELGTQLWGCYEQSCALPSDLSLEFANLVGGGEEFIEKEIPYFILGRTKRFIPKEVKNSNREYGEYIEFAETILEISKADANILSKRYGEGILGWYCGWRGTPIADYLQKEGATYLSTIDWCKQYSTRVDKLFDRKITNGKTLRGTQTRYKAKTTYNPLCLRWTAKCIMDASSNRTFFNNQEETGRTLEEVLSIETSKAWPKGALWGRGREYKERNNSTKLTLQHVTSIELIKSPDFVYDITTELGHFVANGILIHNCYNGIDLNFYKSNGKPKGEHYLWLARWTPEKACMEVIEIAQRARVVIEMYGDTNIIAIQEYARKAFERADGYFARAHHGISREDTVNEYSKAKGLIQMYNWKEPMGLNIIEAQACGCPPIVQRKGAAPELVKDGETGYLVDTIEDVLKLLEMRAVEKIDPQSMRKHIEDKFSLEIFINSWENLLAEVSKGLRW